MAHKKYTRKNEKAKFALRDHFIASSVFKYSLLLFDQHYGFPQQREVKLLNVPWDSYAK